MLNAPSAVESALIRLAATLLSGSGRRASLIVLMFHRVLDRPDPLLPDEPDAASFAGRIGFVARHFNVLPLREALSKLRSCSLPSRAACITFDDGYANNCDIALPILRDHGVPATVFVAPGFLNGGRMFNDTVIEALRSAPSELDLREEGLRIFHLSDSVSRLQAIEEIIPKLKHLRPAERTECVDRIVEKAGAHPRADLMMTDLQVRRLHDAGMEIGAHTTNHPILAAVEDDVARHEIAESRRRLEAITGAPVTSFAYPNGRPRRDYLSAHVDLVRASGFELALSTSWGAADRHSDIYQIPRIAPWDRTSLRYGLRMARAYRQRRYLVA